ncbi:hypothetical protein OC835_001270 [Tilletia horrida]|nr:hypothetical protein OC835_001270 [Tilletia horrida]
MAAGHPTWRGDPLGVGPSQPRSHIGPTSEPAPSKERVKRPHNAWIIYRTEKSRELRDSFLQGLLPPPASGGHTHLLGAGTTPKREADLSKYLAAMWKSESPEVKEKYAERARAEREAHLQKYPGYRFQPRKPTRIKTVQGNVAGAPGSRASPRDWPGGPRPGSLSLSGRHAGQRSQPTGGSRPGPKEDSRDGDSSTARMGGHGRFAPPPALNLAQSGQFTVSGVPMTALPASGSAGSVGRDGSLGPTFFQPASAPPDVTTYHFAANSHRLPWTPLGSSQMASAGHERLPSSHGGAGWISPPSRSDRPERMLQGPVTLIGKSTSLEPKWSSSGPPTYPGHQHYGVHDSRPSTGDKLVGSDVLGHPSASQYHPFDQASVSSSRTSTVTNDHWQGAVGGSSSFASHVGGLPVAESPLPGRHRSVSSYSSGMVVPQGTGASASSSTQLSQQQQQQQQQHLFNSQVRTSHNDAHNTLLQHQQHAATPHYSTSTGPSGTAVGATINTAALVSQQHTYADTYHHHQQQQQHQPYHYYQQQQQQQQQQQTFPQAHESHQQFAQQPAHHHSLSWYDPSPQPSSDTAGAYRTR